MPLYKTDGIVIRTYPLGEHDQIVVLMSPTHGKIRSVAKGSKKTSNSIAGKMGLFFHLSLLIAEGRNLDTISQAEIIESFRFIRTNLNRMAYALYMLELMDTAVHEPEPHFELFELLRTTLKALETATFLPVLIKAFELKILTLLGYAPITQHCVNCNNPPAKMQRFSAKLGGILCHLCFKQDPNAMSISPQGLDLIEIAIHSPIEKISHLEVRPGLVNSLNPILRQCIIDKFGKDLHSRKFLEDITTPCKN